MCELVGFVNKKSNLRGKEINILKNRFFEGEDIGTIIWFILTYQMWKEKWLE